MSRHTALNALHVEAGARMVDFAGWDMPLNYGSQIEEHQAVRTAAGMFDVSHMTVIDLPDDSARSFLRRLVANDVDKLAEPGRALYGALLNERGGVVDDLIVYRRDQGYRAVVNAGTRDKVLAWFAAHNDEGIAIEERDLAMVAVQGPEAIARFETVSGLAVADLPSFSAMETGETMVARTGYTGEDGVEVILPSADAVDLWRGLAGRAALEAEKAAGVSARLTGLVLQGKGVLRHGQTVITGSGEGVITSGVFSPTLSVGIALARIPADARGAAEVEIRGKRLPVHIVRPPFVRNGRRVYKDPVTHG